MERRATNSSGKRATTTPIHGKTSKQACRQTHVGSLHAPSGLPTTSRRPWAPDQVQIPWSAKHRRFLMTTRGSLVIALTHPMISSDEKPNNCVQAVLICKMRRSVDRRQTASRGPAASNSSAMPLQFVSGVVKVMSTSILRQ